jgi:hypothetical protein
VAETRAFRRYLSLEMSEGRIRQTPSRVRSAIRAEVQRLAADQSDREERRIIREQMAELAPHRAD